MTATIMMMSAAQVKKKHPLFGLAVQDDFKKLKLQSQRVD